jgi:hypothetical protein
MTIPPGHEPFSDNRCAGCGLVVAGGGDACHALFEELIARDFSDYRYGRTHRLMVDAYAVQHVERYCRSAKSFAAHLGGLCCRFEHAGDPAALAALQRWLDGRVPLERPEPPRKRGALTIADAHGAPDPETYREAVERWARSAWDAYRALHGLARGYLSSALL